MGRNLDALNDILRGGLGAVPADEPFTILWRASDRSRERLSYDETARAAREDLARLRKDWLARPDQFERTRSIIERAARREGETIFERIVELIRLHANVELRLE